IAMITIVYARLYLIRAAVENKRLAGRFLRLQMGSPQSWQPPENSFVLSTTWTTSTPPCAAFTHRSMAWMRTSGNAWPTACARPTESFVNSSWKWRRRDGNTDDRRHRRRDH